MTVAFADAQRSATWERKPMLTLEQRVRAEQPVSRQPQASRITTGGPYFVWKELVSQT